jgi:hypothetical protein
LLRALARSKHVGWVFDSEVLWGIRPQLVTLAQFVMSLFNSGIASASAALIMMKSSAERVLPRTFPSTRSGLRPEE